MEVKEEALLAVGAVVTVVVAALDGVAVSLLDALDVVGLLDPLDVVVARLLLLLMLLLLVFFCS